MFSLDICIRIYLSLSIIVFLPIILNNICLGDNSNPKLFQTYSNISHSSCKKSGCSTDSYTTIVYGKTVE